MPDYPPNTPIIWRGQRWIVEGPATGQHGELIPGMLSIRFQIGGGLNYPRWIYEVVSVDDVTRDLETNNGDAN